MLNSTAIKISCQHGFFAHYQWHVVLASIRSNTLILEYSNAIYSNKKIILNCCVANTQERNEWEEKEIERARERERERQREIEREKLNLPNFSAINFFVFSKSFWNILCFCFRRVFQPIFNSKAHNPRNRD